MRKSCHEENRQMLEAYKLFQQGQHSESIAIYESILQKTTNSQMKANLVCTISVISSAMGNFNYALEGLEENMGILNKTEALTRVRYLSNLCFLHIVTNHFSEAIEDVLSLRQVVEKTNRNPETINFILSLFFRVSSFQQLETHQNLQLTNLSLIECFYLLNLAFAKQICGFGGASDILKQILPIFLSNKKMQFGLICLRQLLLLPLEESQTLKYQKEFGKIVSMGVLDNYQFDISDAIECCKVISKEILDFCQPNEEEKLSSNTNTKVDDSQIWNNVMKYEKRKLLTNVSIAQEEREVILRNLQMMMGEKNPLVIQQMKRTDFYINSQREFQGNLMNLARYLHNMVTSAKSEAFHSISKQNRQQKLKKSSKALKEKKENNENMSSIVPPSKQQKMQREQKSARISTVTVSRTLTTNKSFTNLQDHKSKRIAKIIRFCESGSFLSKRNYNSDGGEYRFVKVTNSVLKWGKNPQKIEEGCQIYPLKDIRSISYGKVTQTLMKPSNHLLKTQFCFSLHLQKRTLDFYCKDFEQAQNWVVGLSHKLKAINPNIRGYTMGKMLWKKAFMVIQEKYVNGLPKHEKDYYYYPTAHAVILMGKEMNRNQV